MEANQIVLLNDLTKVRSKASDLAMQVGDSVAISSILSGSTLWMAISSMVTTLADHTACCDNLSDLAQNLQRSLADMCEEQEIYQMQVETRFQPIEKCLQVFESQFNKILPILKWVWSSASTSTGSTPSQEIATLKSQVQYLTSTVESLQAILWDSGIPTFGASPSHLDAVVKDMQNQLKPYNITLSGGGHIGTKIFQSFDVVEAWVKAELPTQWYRLFVDAVSLLDFFTCIGHVDADKTFAAFHNQQKTGFTSMYEARVAASVQNVPPMVFGKTSSSGINVSKYIPAITDPDKWEKGVTGIKHQIARGMSGIEYQLETAIDSVLQANPEARQLAKDCLYKAKRFVINLCNFISTDYQKWQSVSEEFLKKSTQNEL